MTLLRLDDVSVRFPLERRWTGRATAWIDAVRNVSLIIEPGETLGIVGESGSGKTTVARCVAGLQRVSSGQITFDGTTLSTARRPRRLCRRIQMVFQDPGSSLNPRQRIIDAVREPMLVHRIGRRRDRIRRAHALLERCGLPDDAAQRYPKQLSGGQRQRVAIARSVAVEPDLLICDEPTSALDVSVQARILDLLRDLQQEHGMASLFISHDMAVIYRMCDRIAVMRQGSIVEIGDRDQIVLTPQAAYTQRLLDAVPRVPAMLTSA